MVELLFRYLLASVVALAVDYGILVLLTELAGLYYLCSAAISFTLGLATNYIISIAWVFPNRRWDNRFGEFFVFAIIGVGGLGLNAAVMWLLTGWLGFHYSLSKLVTVAVVFLWNFGLRRVIVFPLTDAGNLAVRSRNHGPASSLQ